MYRDPEQSIKEPVSLLIEGIDSFRSVVDARIEDGNWERTHIDELVLFISELTTLRYKLLRLTEETW